MTGAAARRVGLALAVGALVAVAALGWTGRTEASVGPGRVELSASLSRAGGTSVELPPLGRITADTHRLPVQVGARVLEVDVDHVQRASAGPDPVGALQAEITGDLPSALRAFVLRALLFAALTGAVAVLLLPGRHLWHAAPGAAGGVIGVSALLAATWLPYDLDAFREPTFEGELVRVPGLINAVERNLGDLDTVRSRVDTVSDRLAELYAASVGDLPGGAAGETSILHVSDLHLNPLAAQLVVQLAGDLGVDAVLDTGDVTSFGLPVEARYGEILDAAPVPYYLVPGNHDSPENRAQLAALDGITVLDGDVVEVGGVRILGVADPAFTATNEMSTEEARDLKRTEGRAVARLVRREDPHVLAVHDRVLAAQSTGYVPVVVAGHLHERTEQEEDGTLVLTVGSSGSAGLETFMVETSRPYEAQVLRFRRGRLVAIDYLRLSGIAGDFVLERRLVPEPEQEEEEATDAPADETPTTDPQG